MSARDDTPSKVLRGYRQEPKTCRPYQRAADWIRAMPWVRTTISRQRASDFAAIAELGDVWGRRLDDLGAPYPLVRWIAAPRRYRQAAVLARYEAACELLRKHHGLTDALFAQLMERFPRIHRRRKKKKNSVGKGARKNKYIVK